MSKKEFKMRKNFLFFTVFEQKIFLEVRIFMFSRGGYNNAEIEVNEQCRKDEKLIVSQNLKN